MLFTSNPPVQIEVQNDRKIIVLTSSRIMFTHMNFIQEYLAMPLITTQAKRFYYCIQTMQTLVQSPNTLQIYFCDWKTQMKLLKVFIIHSGVVQSIYFDRRGGWHIVGSVLQYDTAQVTFKQSISHNEEEPILAECSINNKQYILTSSKLVKRQQQGKAIEIPWRDRMMVLKNTNYEVKIQGQLSADKQRDILCVNGRYILVANKNQVLNTVDFPNTLYIKNSLIISGASKSKQLTINVEKLSNFSDIGTIPAPRGKLHSVYMYEDQLVMLSYAERQIHINSTPLVSENQQKKARGIPLKKKLFGSISKIVEDSHEDMSQYLSKLKQTELKEQFSPTSPPAVQSKIPPHDKSKPIIKDIECSDEIQPEEFNKSDSQVLSRSGLQNLKNTQEAAEVEEFQNIITQSHSFKQKINQDFSLNQGKKNIHSSSNQINNSKKSGKAKQKQSKNSKGSFKKIDHHDDAAETPGFVQVGQNWNSFDRKWDEQMCSEIVKVVQQQDYIQDESQVIEQSQRTLLRSIPGIPTKKIQYFQQKKIKLTKQMVAQIQSCSYTQLITKTLQEQPQRFEQLAMQFMWQLLQEKQCSLLFLEHIQTHNPQYTKDKIKRYFRSYLGKQIYKQKLTQALKQFKINQVPEQALNFPKQFLKTIRLLNKDIYIIQLLHPKEQIIEILLDSYFHTHYNSQQLILIQDQQIDISHPRNMLNILLYLNQVLNLQLECILKVYCKKLLEYQNYETLGRIIEEKIFEICEVDRKVLDEEIKNTIEEQIGINHATGSIQEIIEFINDKQLYEKFQYKVKIMNYLNSAELVYELKQILTVEDPSINIYTFLQDLITQNSCKNLLKINIENIYRTLFYLQEDIHLKNATNQYIQLVREYSAKLCENNLFSEGFRLLNSVSMAIKKSYVCKLLYLYSQSKFVNRFGIEEVCSLEAIVPELFRSNMINGNNNNPMTQSINIKSIPRDSIIFPKLSKIYSCSYEKFITIYQQHLPHLPNQLSYLTFLDFNCAYQLFLSIDNLNIKRKFNKFYLDIQKYLQIEVDDMNQNDQSINPKGKTLIPFGQLKEEEGNNAADMSNSITSTLNQEQILLGEDLGTDNKNKVSKSLTLVNNKEFGIQKANSDKKVANDSIQCNQDLRRLRILVNKSQIFEALEQIYDKYSTYTFLKSLKLVDLQKITLHHLDSFKAIISANIDYPLSRIVPFAIFTQETNQGAFSKIKTKLKSQLTLANFWEIYMIVEILLNRGIEVAKIFLEKIIKYYQNDDLVRVIDQLIATTDIKDDRKYLSEMSVIAKEYGERKIASILAK